MAALKRTAAFALLLGTSAPASAGPLDRWATLVREASLKFEIPEDWIRAVMREESGGQTELNGRPITSNAGAMGLMQVMPDTWADMRRVYRLRNDPYDPHDNVIAGTAYLRAMYDRFGFPGAFAAYNAGPQRYSEYLAAARPLPDETITYVAHVIGSLRPVAAVRLARSEMRRRKKRERVKDTLFLVRNGAPSTTAPASQVSAPFAIVGSDDQRLPWPSAASAGWPRD